MDPVTIAVTVVNVLLPFFSKSVDEFASKLGDAAFDTVSDKVSALWSLLKRKWSGDPVATADLTRFEKNPEGYQEFLKQTLIEKLAEDKDLAAQVSQLLQEIGPSLEVHQKMEEGEGIVGVEAEEFNSGTVNSTQEIKKGKDVTGAKIKRIG